MKLAEALASRADMMARLTQLAARAKTNAKTQEGETPSEDATALLAEHDRIAAELEVLIAQINARNLEIEVAPGFTMTQALARRDVLRLRHKVRSDLADAASVSIDRFTRSELRTVSAVDVRALRSEADAIAQELRSLDTMIQATNWRTELDSG
jgi:hypothetical protein